MSEAPIGIFDSGLGGLSVWKACKKLLPHEHFIYVADQANCPYGPKPITQIQDFCRNLVEFLLKQNAKLIILACNTATAAAIQILRQDFPISFVGMEPAIKPATEHSQRKVIGILATEGTLQGEHFQKSKAKYSKGIEVIIQVGEGLVDLVEAGKIEGHETETLLKKYLEPMKKRGIDHLVLGCTHYPFLRTSIREILGDITRILDPAPAVAQQVKRVLSANNLLKPDTKLQSPDVFYTTGDPQIAQASLNLLSDILGQKIRIGNMP